MRKTLKLYFFGLAILLFSSLTFARHPLVLMTDFGLKDGAVAAMRGIALGVDSSLTISDLAHDIPQYDIRSGAYRLYQTVNYWPKGTVFVSVVDPSVGNERTPVVLKTRSGYYFVNSNNGLLTLIAEREGIEAIRQIDGSVSRLQRAKETYTLRGRDLYAYVGAQLASGKVSFDQIGHKLSPDVLVKFPYQKAVREGEVIQGSLPVIVEQYGNIWTNIPKTLFDQLGVRLGENVRVQIFHKAERVVDIVMPYQSTIGSVNEGQPLMYFNSLLNVSFALNQQNFATHYQVSAGPDWSVRISKENSAR